MKKANEKPNKDLNKTSKRGRPVREIKVDIKWLDENGDPVPPGIARLEKFPGWKRFVDFVAEQMAEKEWKLFLEGKDNIISQSIETPEEGLSHLEKNKPKS